MGLKNEKLLYKLQKF